MKTKMTLAVMCVVLAVAGLASAGPKAVERALPELFFNEDTAVVVHLNLEQITSERIIAAITSIVPAEHQADMDLDELRQNLAGVDQFVAPLKQLGVSRLTTVMIAKGGEDTSQMASYVLVPVSASLTDEQKQQLQGTLAGIGMMFQMQAQPYSNWIVLHAEGALPEEAMDLTMRDAPFNDALKSNPDHDACVVFVPTEAMVKQMKQGMAEATAEAEGDAQDEMANLEVLAESEWYYVSAVLGSNPELYFSSRASSPAKAAQFASAWDSAMSALKDAARKELAEDLAEAKKEYQEHGTEYDPENYDPQPIVAMIDSLNADSEETRMVIHLTRGEMKTFVNGVIVSVERLMDDLFSF